MAMELQNPAPGDAGNRNKHRVSVTADSNITLDDTQAQTERALLHGLLTSPVRLVIGLADAYLQPRDFLDEQARTVYRAILAEANEIAEAGETDKTVNPTRVVNALRAQGEYTGTVPRLMVNVSATGIPAPAWATTERLARDLVGQRLRHALEAVGITLQAASHGSHADIRLALQHARHLESLAKRAGVIEETGEVK